MFFGVTVILYFVNIFAKGFVFCYQVGTVDLARVMRT
jgi:hypothetical protein